MARQSYRVSGRVINRTTRRGVGGLRVEAWDRDIKHNDALGTATTDEKGAFAIAYGPSQFADEPRRQRPDLFFKVFRGRKLLATTAAMPIENAGRRRSVTIEVDLDAGGRAGTRPAGSDHAKAGQTTTGRAKARQAKARQTKAGQVKAGRAGATPNEPTKPATAPLTGGSPEVSIHELGESIAASLANVQQELDRYQSPLGAFVVDEIDLTIPVQMRVDELGQVMVVITSTEAGTTPTDGTQIHLRIKPVLGSHNDPLMAGTQSLSHATALPWESVEALKSARIFTVNDFRRVTRTPQGREAVLRKLGWGDDQLDQAAEQMKILTLPVLPVAISSILTTRLGFRRIGDFLMADSGMIANVINAELGGEKEEGSTITPEHVDCWKSETRTYIAVKPPCVTK